MKIKRPFNFMVGLLCSMCFCIDLVKGKDISWLIIMASVAVVNLIGSTID